MNSLPMVHKAKHAVKEFGFYKFGLCTILNDADALESGWTPPPLRGLKINVDAFTPYGGKTFYYGSIIHGQIVSCYPPFMDVAKAL